MKNPFLKCVSIKEVSNVLRKHTEERKGSKFKKWVLDAETVRYQEGVIELTIYATVVKAKHPWKSREIAATWFEALTGTGWDGRDLYEKKGWDQAAAREWLRLLVDCQTRRHFEKGTPTQLKGHRIAMSERIIPIVTSRWKAQTDMYKALRNLSSNFVYPLTEDDRRILREHSQLMDRQALLLEEQMRRMVSKTPTYHPISGTPLGMEDYR